MSLKLILPVDGEPAVVDFAAFQRAWNRWQLSISPAERGNAAEIALKNLERGLTGKPVTSLIFGFGIVWDLLFF